MAWYEGDIASYAAADASAARREAERNENRIERLERVIVELVCRIQDLEDLMSRKVDKPSGGSEDGAEI